jgi:hypothetical protein
MEAPIASLATTCQATQRVKVTLAVSAIPLRCLFGFYTCRPVSGLCSLPGPKLSVKPLPWVLPREATT